MNKVEIIRINAVIFFIKSLPKTNNFYNNSQKYAIFLKTTKYYWFDLLNLNRGNRNKGIRKWGKYTLLSGFCKPLLIKNNLLIIIFKICIYRKNFMPVGYQIKEQSTPPYKLYIFKMDRYIYQKKVQGHLD